MADTILSAAPAIILKNGIYIANFSSGHPFTFDDVREGEPGSVLPACEDDRVKALALNRCDVESEHRKPGRSVGKWFDVSVGFQLSDAVLEHLWLLESSDVEIVLCPLPVITALKDADMFDPSGVKKDDARITKARTIIRASRETMSGPGLIRYNKFGI